jgi:signal peptidase
LAEWSNGIEIEVDLAEVEDATPPHPVDPKTPTKPRQRRRHRRAERREQTRLTAVPEPLPEPVAAVVRQTRTAQAPTRHLIALDESVPRSGRRLARGTRLTIYILVLTVAAALWYFSLGTLLVSRGTALASGWEVTTIATGSMRPALNPGDLVAYAPVESGDLKRNLIIVFDNPAIEGGMIVHRLVGFNSDGTLITKGDANEDVDSTPISVDAVRGVVKMVSPYGGFPNMLLHQGKTERFLALVGVLFLAAIIVHAPTPGVESERRHKRRRRR